jgi:hypothetical protein
MEDRSRYIVELVAEEQQFAAGTKKAQDDLRKLGAEAAKLDRSRLQSLKAQAAAEDRLRRFNRLSDTQKLVVLEERRVNLAKQLAYAQERGAARQAAIIRNRMSGIDAMAAGVGANTGVRGGRTSGGRGSAGGSPIMRMAGAGMTAVGLGGLGGMDGMAGPLGGTIVAIMAIGRTIHAIFAEAFERSQAAQAALAERKKLLEVSEGATEGLASVGVALGTLWAITKKILGEIWGAAANVGQGAVGLGASIAGNVARGLGMTKVGNWLGAQGERMAGESVGNRPKWLGGLGGVDAQAGAVADAKRAELDAKKKTATEPRVRAASNPALPSFGGLGSFGSTGSSSGMYVVAGERGLNAKILTIQADMLRTMRDEVRATRAVETAVRENGV